MKAAETSMAGDYGRARSAGPAALLLAALAGAGTAPAAESPAPAAAGPEDLLAEVVVTAQRRPERQHEVPVSMTVVGPEALQATGARDLSEIARFAPNVSFDDVVTQSGGGVTTSIYVRGIGQSDFLQTTDPGVGLFVDGVYVARAVGSLLDVAEVERVEVLRGPQGTLFGRNTIGGAINVTSRQPGDVAGLLARVTTGSDDRLDAFVRADVPVSPVLRTTASFASFDQDGYQRRPNAGDTLGNRHRRAVRIAAVYEPTETWQAAFSADYTRARERGAVATLERTVQTCPRGAVPAVGTCDQFAAPGAAPGQSYLFNNVAPVNRAAGGAGVGRSVYDARWVSADPFVNLGTGPEVTELDLWGTSLTVEGQFAVASLRSITAYRTFDAYFVRDTDVSPFEIVAPSSTLDQRQFSQELQLYGTAFEERFDWLGGLYWFDELADDDSDFVTASFALQSGGVDIGSRSVAAFAQGSWRFTPALQLTAGARYTDERRRYTPTQYFVSSVTGVPPAGLVIVPRAEYELDYSKPTWRVALEGKPRDRVLVYGSWSTGFKSGGFVQRNQVVRTTLPTFGPENVEVAEIGAKVFRPDRKLSASVAVFDSRYRDLQIRVIDSSFSPVTSNAGDARIRGVETELEAAPHPRLRFSGGLGWMDAEYRRIAPNAPDIRLDSKLTDTSDWSANLAVTATAPLAVGSLSARVDWNWKSAWYNDAENTPELRQGAVGLLNVSATWRAPLRDAAWSLTGGVRNATDEHYRISGYSLAAQGPIASSYARPREWFLTLDVEL
jgi:iron complex outermembrane receptor protein